MLTQFNVGIVYMLCHLCNEVEFVKPNKQDFAVVFIEFRQWNPVMCRFLNEIDKTTEKLQRVLTLFPINKLRESYNSPGKAEGHSTEHSTRNGIGSVEQPEDCNIFYKSVTEVNHLCVKEQVTGIIANILEQDVDSRRR
jgi:hypothetical protein